MCEACDTDGSVGEPVNVLDYLEFHGIPRELAHQILLHLVLTQSFAMPSDVRTAAAELGVTLPVILPSSDTMH